MKKRIVSKPTQKLLSVLLAGVMLLVSIPMTVVGEGLPIGQIGADDNAQLVGTPDTFYEDVSMRDEFSKHYVLESGERYAVIFPEAVHYEEDGEWKEVDNRLTYNFLTGKYVSANPKFTTTFAANASATELVSITSGEYTVSWGISFSENSGSELMKLTAGASVTNGNDTAERLAAAKAEQASLAKASAETNQAFDTEEAETVYKNTVTDIGKAASSISYGGSTNSAVSLRYSVAHGKVEEDIILRSKSDFSSYTMTVNTGGLTVTAETDGSVIFKTADGETVFNIDAPWMKDSAYGFSKDIAVTVTQTGNTATVTYTPSAEWLNSEDRVYPVLIDPTIITRDYTSNYIDTYVDSTYSSTNCLDYADEQTLMVGVSPVGEFTSFIKILNIPDISTYDYVIINSAKLHMWSLYGVNYPLYLSEITESWENSGFTSMNIPNSKYITEAEAWTNGQYEFDLSSFMMTEVFDKYHDYNYYWENLHHGFMLESASAVSDTITTLCSSEASSQRPIMTLTYDYMYYPMFRDGAVYNFKSATSSKYMTVHNGSNITGTNVYQYTENDTASQAFKLEYIETGEYYKIRAMCSSGGSDKVIGFPYGNTAYDSSGYETANVSLYNNSTGYDVQWLIEPVGTGNLFKIISKADHNLALTVQGLSDGSPDGTSTGSSGNVKIMEYIGGANQHWIIEAGGVELSHMYDISNAEDDEYLSVGESIVYNCGVDTVGGTVTWSSSNTGVATVFNGIITAQGIGAATITATVKDASGNTVNTYSILVVMTLADGIYYIGNITDSWSYIQYNFTPIYYASAGNDSRPYMFKVYHIGEGKYSIRSMYDNQYGLTKTSDGLVGHGYMGTSQMCYSSEQPDGVPEASQWYITGNNYDGYVIENVTGGVIGKDQWEEIYVEATNGTSYQRWLFTEVGPMGEGTGIEIDTSVSAVVVGETKQIKAHFYSDDMNKNGQDITWSVTNGSGSASITSFGVVTGVNKGDVTVKAIYNNSSVQATKTINVEKKAIIIVPGIMCSQIFADGNIIISSNESTGTQTAFLNGTRLWDPDKNEVSLIDKKILALAQDTNGIPKYSTKARTPIINQNNIGNGFQYGTQDMYRDLYNKLYDEFYDDGYDIVLFEYDWRKDPYNTAQELNTFINNNYYGDIVFVSHSMGGLVSSYYLAQGYTQRNKVDKHISIGTPYLGAAKMVDVFFSGDALNGLLVQGLTSSAIKNIIGNIQSIYGLLPYEKYFSSYLKFLEEPQNSYDDTIDCLNNLIGWNNDLYTSVASNQSKLFINNNHISSYVDSYYIVGNWHNSIEKIKLSNDILGKLKLTTEKTVYGDGTVTLESATISGTLDAARVFYMYDNSDLELDATHTGMVESICSLDLIADIISGDVTVTTAENYLITTYGAYKTNRVME